MPDPDPDPMRANPADPYRRGAQTFPHLTPEQIDRAREFGRAETHPAGAALFRRGERSVDFFVILDGAVEILEHAADGATQLVTTHAAGQFTGELDLFNDREILVDGRIGAGGGSVLRLGRNAFRRLLAAEPDIAETVLRAFILRRMGFIEHGQAAVELITSPRQGSGDALRIQRFLGRNGYPLRVLDAEAEEGAALLADAGLKPEDTPVVRCGPGRLLRQPTNRALADCLGLTERLDPGAVFDVVVVGAGPAGLAAAVYAGSEGLSTLVLEAEAPGGQAGTSSKIENYLGFPTGISGEALAGRAQIQAQKFGARIGVARAVARLEPGATEQRLQLEDGGTVAARTVVLATGASYRRLDGIEGLERFEGHGIHYAATAAEAAVCGGEAVVVVGGGNSAGQAAVFLARRAAMVHMLIRGEGLADTMSDYLVSRIAAADRITLHVRTEIIALAGGRHLDRVRWRDRTTGAEEEHPIANLFLMLGAVPNTGWLAGSGIALDPGGFVLVGAESGPFPPGRPPLALETSRPGVFAVGDVRAGSVKRVASAVGEGSVVVASVHAALAAALART